MAGGRRWCGVVGGGCGLEVMSKVLWSWKSRSELGRCADGDIAEKSSGMKESRANR